MSEQVEQLIEQADGMPYGEAKSVVLEEVLRTAEALRDPMLAFRVRMNLTEAYQYGGEHAKCFTTFSRCLADYDAEPGRFSGWHVHELHWHFKWIVSDIQRFPEIPLQRAHDVLDEMERRYGAAGYGMHAVYAGRCAQARHVGDAEAADRWFEKWQTTPRDTMSDCEGCDPTGKVEYLIWRGRDQDAVDLAAPVVAGDLTCHVQPQSILTALLPAYVRMGRLEEAATAHRRAYRLIQGEKNNVDDFGQHLEFLARTGNEARGLEILQRELPLFETAPNPSAAMRFASSAALLLRRLTEQGNGDQTIRRQGRDMSVRELGGELAAAARELASRFDRRNGTTERGRQVEERLAAQPLVGHLPLTPHDRRVEAPIYVPEPPPAAATDEELLDLAERCWAERRHVEALAAWARVEARAGQGGGRDADPALAGRLADGRGLAAAVRQDFDTAQAEWARAAELHAEAGDEARRQVTLGRIGLLLCQRGSVDEGLPMVEKSTAHAYGEAGVHRLAQALVAAGRLADAVATLEEALSTFTAPAERGELLLLLARCLAEARPDDAAGVAAEARDALRAAGGGGSLAQAAMDHAHLLTMSPFDPEVVLGAYGEAVAHTPRTEPRLRAAAHTERGELLVGLGRGAEGAEDLIEAVALFTAEGDTERAAIARIALGDAYLMTDRPLAAAEAAEEALAVLQDESRRDALAWVRGRALRDLGDLEKALENLRQAAAGLDRPDDFAPARESVAEVLNRLDRDAEAAAEFALAAERYRAIGDHAGEARTLRRHAVSLYWADEEETALKAIATARDVLPALADPGHRAWETATLAFYESQILASLGRRDDAIRRAEEALAGFRELGDDNGAEQAEWALEYLRATD